MILPSERQVVLELSHVVLDHIHQGMRIYPTAMVAALVLQNTNGLERGKRPGKERGWHCHLMPLPSLRRADGAAGVAEG